jgi:hypothetical protein
MRAENILPATGTHKKHPLKREKRGAPPENCTTGGGLVSATSIDIIMIIKPAKCAILIEAPRRCCLDRWIRFWCVCTRFDKAMNFDQALLAWRSAVEAAAARKSQPWQQDASKRCFALQSVGDSSRIGHVCVWLDLIFVYVSVDIITTCLCWRRVNCSCLCLSCCKMRSSPKSGLARRR